jgi:disulfide oxidoreductase YuzD
MVAGAEKYSTVDMSFSKSTRNNSQHLMRSTSPGSDFIVNDIYINKSNSLNEDPEHCELILDENYL